LKVDSGEAETEKDNAQALSATEARSGGRKRVACF